jgi:hypothetical protein
MENKNSSNGAAVSPADQFTVSYAAFERAKAEFVKAAPNATQFSLSESAYALMTAASRSMDDMMRIEAPTMWALHLKLRAISDCPWPWNCEFADYEARLTADAGTLSLQFPGIWLGLWTGHGGSATVTNDKLSVFKPEFSLSADAVFLKRHQAEAELSEDQASEQRSWHAAFYDGRMRELGDMLDAVPGAWLGVTAIVAETPAAGLPSNLVTEDVDHA